jgi:hypothetical protein
MAVFDGILQGIISRFPIPAVVSAGTSINHKRKRRKPGPFLINPSSSLPSIFCCVHTHEQKNLIDCKQVYASFLS